MVLKEMSFEEFQDGLCDRNGTILAILYFYVTVMPPIKFLAQSDLRFGRRCHLKNFKMAAAAILDIGMERF